MKNEYSKYQKLREFVPVSIRVPHRVRWLQESTSSGDGFLDVTDLQSLLSINPVIIGISKPLDRPFSKDPVLKLFRNELAGLTKAGSICTAKLHYFKSIDIDSDHSLHLYFVSRVKNRHLNILLRNFLLCRLYLSALKRKDYQGRLTWSLYRQYLTFYSFPRHVFLIKIGDRCFPIDLCYDDLDHDIFIFSIRSSNRSIPDIVRESQVTIYSLGGSGQRPAYSPLDASKEDESKLRSERLIREVLRVKVYQSHLLGNQRLFLGVCQEREIIDRLMPKLGYLHYLQFLGEGKHAEKHNVIPYREVYFKS